MAKRHLEQYDKNGNMLDIYLNEEEVMVGDQTLADKLADMEDDIDDAAQTGGEGTVTGIKVGSNTYEPTEGVVDISGAVPTSTSDLSNNSDFTTKTYVDAAVQTALNNLMNGQSVTDAIDTFNEVKAFLDGINNQETLAAKLATLVPQTRTINGKSLSSNVTIGINDIDGLAAAIAAAGSGAVSVSIPDPADGTFTIHVGSTDYTINLNHTHENMAKLEIVDEEPASPARDTIYALVDDAEDPAEIQSLWIAGLEFVGGGGSDDQPRLISPGRGITIDFEGQQTVNLTVRGRNLTSALSLAVTGNFTVSANGSTVSSISANDANNGVTLTLTKGIGFNGGTLSISSSGSEIETNTCNVTDSEDVVQLEAVKLTGSQWLQTDFVPTPNTDVEMTLKFTENSRSWDTNEKGYNFLTCYTLQESQKQYAFYLKEQSGTNAMLASIVTNSTVNFENIPRADVVLDKSTFSYSHAGLMGFVAGENGTAYTKQCNAVSQQTDPLTIGLYHSSQGVDTLFNKFILTIYELKITDSGVVVRDYVPMRISGVPGLYDTKTGHFMSSKTNVALEEVTLNS